MSSLYLVTKTAAASLNIPRQDNAAFDNTLYVHR